MVDALVIALIAVSVAGAFASGFFLALKAVQMGLKWEIQKKNDLIPTTQAEDKELAKNSAAAVLSNQEILNEYLFGEQPKDDKK